MRPLSLARTGPWLLVAALLSVSVQAAAQEKSAAATRQYNAAVGLHNSGEYELAADMWRKFMTDFKTDPRVPAATHYLGVCYSKQNKLDEAVETFETIIKSYPEFNLLADTYLNLGLTQYNMAHAGKAAMYDAAAKTFNTLATKYPEGKHVAEATFYEGECLYNRGKRKEAAEKYNVVVTKYPTAPVMAQALFALGVTQSDLGQHQTALETYDAFLKKFSQDALATEVSMWRGESLFALKQFAEAAKAYAVAAGKKGFRMADYATVRQADSLAAQQQFAEAAALYASVPVKFKGSQYTELGNLEAGKKYYAAGDAAKALEYLNLVIAAGGKSSPEAAHWAARSLLKQNKPADALAVVEKVLPKAADGSEKALLLMDQADATYEIPARRGESAALYAALAAKYPNDPAAPQAMYMAAFAAMGEADYQAAVTHANAFLAAHSGHELEVGVSHVLAESNLLLNKYAEAEKLYDQLLRKAPGDGDAEIWKVHRGTALYLQKKYQEAIAALEPVMAEIGTPDLLAEGWYRIGRSQAALKQFDAAVQSLEASLKAQSKWKLADDTRLVLAYAYQQTGQLDQAKQNAQKVIADFPDSTLLDMAHYRLGECARLGGDLKTAVAEYQRVLKDWPATLLERQTLYGLGWAQLGQEDYAAAETAFTTLMEKHPNDKLIPRARYGRGMARQQLQKYAPALQDVQALLAADPSPSEKSRARHILGLCEKGLKQFDKAVVTFQELLQEDPGYADKVNVYFELGWAQKSLKKEAEAEATFAKLAEEFPDHSLAADSQYLVGDYAYDQKDYQKAALVYYAAMNKAGNTKLGEEAAYKLGLCYYLQDDLTRAQQMFNYQQVTWPEGPLVSDGAYMEGECLLKQKKYPEALAAYEKVKNPTNEDVKVLTLLHSADAAGLSGQWDKSLELATGCVAQFPNSPHSAQALYQQGWAQQNLDKLTEALAIYEQVIAKSNEEPAARAQFMIGEIQFKQQKYAEAIKSYYKVIYGYGYPALQADATYEAARCFEAMKRKPQALKLYQTLVEKYPQSDKASLAKERIEALQ